MSPSSAEKREELRRSRALRTMLPTLEPHTWSGELQEKSKSRTDWLLSSWWWLPGVHSEMVKKRKRSFCHKRRETFCHLKGLASRVHKFFFLEPLI